MDAYYLLEMAEKHAATARRKERDFKETGTQRYERESKKYAELSEVYRMALMYQSNINDDRMRRLGKYAEFVKTYVEHANKPTYTVVEVASLLKKLEEFVF